MRQLQRDPVAPTGLSRYQHGRDQWGAGTPSDQEKQGIWDKLLLMQQGRCAYCEGSLTASRRHIEHFRQRSRYPQGTFDWNNLFGSCNRDDSCGRHKDRCGAYRHQDLIKPDLEDPEHFLVFLPNGSVRPRAALTPDEKHRAEETIRILNLNGVLRQIRQTEVAGYIQTAEAFAAMAQSFPEKEWLPLLQEELSNVANLPYATAVRHVLTRQSD